MVGDNISGWTGSFVLGNITNVPVYFKIKSNAKGYCEASPSRAEIKPFEEVNIMVSYHKAASEDVILQLESIYKPCEGDTDLTSVWQREEFKLFWNIAETELR